MKRLFDVTCSAAGLLILSPILVVLALAVWLERCGPVVFRHERVGLDGKPIGVLKFRTMRTGVGGGQVTSANDARITPLGKRLRSTKLDELPQLFNVLRGDMSLVGPRPEVASYCALWPAVSRARVLSVRPGITDPATLLYRREAEELSTADDPEAYYVSVILPRKLELYERYVKERSLAGDVRILIATVKSVVCQ